MSKYINADELKRYIKTVYITDIVLSEVGRTANMCGQMILEYIDSLPFADVVEVKHGEWDDSKVAFFYICSECGCPMPINKDEVFWEWCKEYNYNFCPNCGADMRERKETE